METLTVIIIGAAWALISFMIVLGMCEACCDYEPGDTFFVRPVVYWDEKTLFQKIIIISLNIFCIVWVSLFWVVGQLGKAFK